MAAQKGTNAKYNTLSAKQRKMAEALMNPEFDGTITELCETLNVPRRTYYNWLDNPAFRDYMTSLVDKYADSELSTVWKALIDQCAKGNVKAIKLYFELRNKAKSTSNGILDSIIEAVKNV